MNFEFNSGLDQREPVAVERSLPAADLWAFDSVRPPANCAPRPAPCCVDKHISTQMPGPGTRYLLMQKPNFVTRFSSLF
jgi:hypothetical protein